jgi:hypothetical protein
MLTETFPVTPASGPRLLTWQSPQIQIAGPSGKVPFFSSSSQR